MMCIPVSNFEFYFVICKCIPKGYPLYDKRFGKSSYKIMRDSYLRVLDTLTGVCPSSERIVQDITKCWGENLDQICYKRGGEVPGLGNRAGKRTLKGANKRGDKWVKQEWKALDNLHPDILPVWKAYIDRFRERHKS